MNKVFADSIGFNVHGVSMHMTGKTIKLFLVIYTFTRFDCRYHFDLKFSHVVKMPTTALLKVGLENYF